MCAPSIREILNTHKQRQIPVYTETTLRRQSQVKQMALSRGVAV